MVKLKQPSRTQNNRFFQKFKKSLFKHIFKIFYDKKLRISLKNEKVIHEKSHSPFFCVTRYMKWLKRLPLGINKVQWDYTYFRLELLK